MPPAGKKKKGKGKASKTGADIPTTGTLGIDEIANLLLTHGFPSQKGAEVGTAVVLCESAGKIDARNVNSDGSIDRGLWQINKRWHPDITDKCAYNPACSTMAASRISGLGTNFGAWTCYKSGAYKKHLAAAERAVDRVRKSTTPGDIAGAAGEQAKKVLVDPLVAVGQFLAILTKGQTWVRVLLVIVGAVIGFMSIRWLMANVGGKT
jgi:hypothetical protein